MLYLDLFLASISKMCTEVIASLLYALLAYKRFLGILYYQIVRESVISLWPHGKCHFYHILHPYLYFSLSLISLLLLSSSKLITSSIKLSSW